MLKLLRLTVLMLVLLICSTAFSQAEEWQPLSVAPDEARVLQLDRRAEKLIIGDQVIAGGTLWAANQAIITGKAIGKTHIVALDRKGLIINQYAVEVKPYASPVAPLPFSLENELPAKSFESDLLPSRLTFLETL